MTGVAIVGAGRIGIPWGAVLAAELEYDVTYIDVDEERVATINRGDIPFEEPQLDDLLSAGVEGGRITATTDMTAVSSHRYVAFTVNAQRHRMTEFLDIIREYMTDISGDQTIVVRTTLPINMIGRIRSVIDQATGSDPTYVIFPERLAEGKAVEEIQELPKIVGVETNRGREAMQDLLAGLGCKVVFTEPEMAMFVKLIDNSYRDALFAVANQIAYAADQVGLNAHDAISFANHEYPRNNIPKPGLVGGKCLPKDPHFLMDEQICDQPTTPDLFNVTRRTNTYLPSYIVTRILRLQPSKVAMLGLSYKRDVGDTYNSPAKRIADDLSGRGITVSAYDPYISGYNDIERTVTDADIVVLAVNHTEFDGIEPLINEHATPDTILYDIWGLLEPSELTGAYRGFGIDGT